jgi:protein translocase SecG subunit
MILTYFVTVIHVIVCFFLIGVVLLQQGKSADLAGAFGGQGSQTAFGPRGAANLLTNFHAHLHQPFCVDRPSLRLALRAGRLEAGTAVANDQAGKIVDFLFRYEAERQPYVAAFFTWWLSAALTPVRSPEATVQVSHPG